MAPSPPAADYVSFCRALTRFAANPTIAAMRTIGVSALVLTVLLVGGCGLVYQAASGYRANKMEQSLQAGQTMPEIHQVWGEPDIRTYLDHHTEIWSYAKHANRDDYTATLLYTSAKEGDAGTFVDLKFEDGKLVSWDEAQHTMPAKEGSGFSAGFSGAPTGGTAHY
jgi:hypothetical protein